MLHTQPQETLHHDGGLQGAVTQRVSSAHVDRSTDGDGSRRLDLCAVIVAFITLNKHKHCGGACMCENSENNNITLK